MKTVLVIEDERGILDNVVEILSFEGYDVLSALDGNEGVKLAQEQVPSLILCDIRMPELDGYDVVRVLRSDPTTVEIPVIIMTAKTSFMRQDFVEEMNIAHCLMKPFSAFDLIDVVRAHIGND